MNRPLTDKPDGVSTVRTLRGLGSVRGSREGSLLVFRGLPYAAPPTGERRFLPPQAAIPWLGTRDATRSGPIAPQPALRAVEGVLGPIVAPQDEDCLTMDLWAPADASGTPVLVWIHGGGFLSGAGSLPWYDGGYLAASHGLVVVSLNYRVGALGFLGLNGNLGIQDQVEALCWIQNQIAVFGGDPEQVTVAGQSGGAHNIVSLLASKGTRGLFQRAILQSPPLGIGLLSAAEGTRRRELFFEQLGMRGDERHLLAHLQSLSVAKLLAAQGRVSRALAAAQPNDLRPPFLPGQGPPHDLSTGEWLEEAVKNVADRGLEVLLGWTRDEANLYGPGNSALSEPFLERMTDSIFAAPCRNFACACARAGGRAFLYRFDWRSPLAGLGACHCLDIPFALGTWRAWMDAPLLAGADRSQFESLSAEMMDCWAGFVKEGNPGFAPVSAEGLPFRVFDR